MRQEQIQTLRDTHKTVSTWVPLLTAALTVSGVVLASLERQAETQTEPPQQQPESRSAKPKGEYSPVWPTSAARIVPVISPRVAADATVAPPPSAAYAAYARPVRLSPFAYLGALLVRLLRVLIGAALVLALVSVYFASDHTWRAIELTVLILLALYLTERVARARRAV